MPYRAEPSGPYRIHAPQRSPLDTLVGILGMVIGILVFIGFLAFQAVYLIPAPCYSTPCPVVPAPQAAYEAAVRALAWVAVVALDLSVGLSVMIAFLLGTRSDVPDSTRRSAFYFATIYLAVYTIFGTLLFTPLLGLVRYL